MSNSVKSSIRKLSFDEIFSRQPNLEELQNLPRLPLYALVEDIRSMHNVGSIFRSSDGVRLSTLFLSGYTARPPRREIDKTALGSTESVPWEYKYDSSEIIEGLKKKGVEIVALEHTSHSVPYTQASYRFPLCVVVGNEVDGLSEAVVKKADLAVEIPMLGLKQSLNVSVAYAIVMYHILYKYLENKEVKP